MEEAKAKTQPKKAGKPPRRASGGIPMPAGKTFADLTPEQRKMHFKRVEMGWKKVYDHNRGIPSSMSISQ